MPTIDAMACCNSNALPIPSSSGWAFCENAWRLRDSVRHPYPKGCLRHGLCRERSDARKNREMLLFFSTPLVGRWLPSSARGLTSPRTGHRTGNGSAVDASPLPSSPRASPTERERQMQGRRGLADWEGQLLHPTRRSRWHALHEPANGPWQYALHAFAFVREGAVRVSVSLRRDCDGCVYSHNKCY